MYNIYVVSAGDTIESIAERFNTTPQVIYDLNSFAPNQVLEIGQRIIVPTSRIQAFDDYIVKKGDNLYSIAKKFNTNEEVLASLNGIKEGDYIYTNEVLLVPTEGVTVYVTKQGDTLQNAVKKMNSNYEQVYLQNQNIYLLPDQLLIYKKSA